MNRDAEINRYEMLNRTCHTGATVIFGNACDMLIPIQAVCDYYFVKADIVNRSFPSLSANEAATLYQRCVAPIKPARVLIHLSDEVMDAEFDRRFLNLVNTIGKDTEIGFLACGRADDDKHLAALCDSCRVAFCDPNRAGCDLETLRDLYISGLRSNVTLPTLSRMLFSSTEEASEQTVAANAHARRTFADFFRLAEAK